ncbi:MAG: AsmA family protein [Pseudomonadota bacterium]
MKRALKIIAIIFGVIIALFILAALLVSLLVDPNDYKETISSQAKSATGRDVNIEGDIELSTFPWFALNLGRVTVGNAEGFEEPVFASIEKTEISLSLLPLVSGEVETNVLRLEGLNVALTRKPDGTTNWDDLAGGGVADETSAPEGEEAPETKPESSPETEQEPAKPLELNIGGIEITNANIIWDDQQANARYHLSNANIVTGAITRNDTFDFAINSDFNATGTQNLSGNIAITSNITANLETQTAQIDELAFNLKASGEAIPGDEQTVSMLIEQLVANWSQGDIALKGFALKALGAELTASVDGKQLMAEKPTIAVELGAEPFNLREALVQMNMADVAPSDKLLNNVGFNIKLDGGLNEVINAALNVTVDDIKLNLPNAVFNNADQTLQTGDLTLTGSGLDLKTNIQVSQVMTAPQLNGDLQLKELDLKALMANLGLPAIETTDDTALRKIDLSTKLAGSPTGVALSDLQFILDSTTLTGSASVAEFEKPVIRFNLNVDDINVDRYLPPPAEVVEQAPPPEQGGGVPPGIDVMLQKLDLEGEFRIRQLQASNLKMANIVMTAISKAGRLSISPKMQLYEGGLDGNVTVDVSGYPPTLSINNVLSGVQAGPLLDDLQNGNGQLSGKGDLNIALTARLDDPTTLMKSLNGPIRFSFTNGAIKGVNIAQSIRQAKAMFSGGAAAEANSDNAPPQTDFSELYGTFEAGDGLLQGTELVVKAPFVRADGTGVFSLIEQTIDYRLNVSVVGIDEGQGGRELQELVGLTIPVQVDGTAAAPKVGVALGDLLKAQAKNKAKEKIGEALIKQLGGDEGKDGEKKDGDPVKKLLGDLFK